MKKVNLENSEKIQAPFEVPDGFFDQLENRIHKQIGVEDKPSFVPKWRLALVPALLIILISGVLLVNNYEMNQNLTSSQLLAEISNEEILSYLAYSDLTESEIVSLAGEEVNLFPGDINYLEDIELKDEDLDQLLNQLEAESEYL